MVGLDRREGRAVIPCMLVDPLACGGGRKLHGSLLGVIGLLERRDEPPAGNAQKVLKLGPVGGEAGRLPTGILQQKPGLLEPRCPGWIGQDIIQRATGALKIVLGEEEAEIGDGAGITRPVTRCCKGVLGGHPRTVSAIHWTEGLVSVGSAKPGGTSPGAWKSVVN